jgi:hypothetical protein
VGPEVDGDGTHWQHVVAPDGKEGFVPSSFALTTQVPTPTPVVATATSGADIFCGETPCENVGEVLVEAA